MGYEPRRLQNFSELATKIDILCENRNDFHDLEEIKQKEREKRLIERCLSAKIEADAAEKFHSKHKITVSEALATDFLQKNKIAALRMYLLIRRDFSGKIHFSKINELAKSAGKCRAYCLRTVRQLLQMGHLEQKPGGWLFCIGTRRYNVANGKMNAKMCRVPQNCLESPKLLRTFIYSCWITRASKNANSKPQRFNDLSAGSVKNGVSISYLAKYLGVSTFTACKHRKRASDHKIIKVVKDYRLLAQGNASDIKEWREHCPIFHRCTIERPTPGHFQLFERMPSKVEIGVFSKKRKFHFSQEEKQAISKNFIPCNSPVLSKPCKMGMPIWNLPKNKKK